MAQKQEDGYWFTSRGKRIHVGEGESKQDAFNRAFANQSKKSDTDKKSEQKKTEQKAEPKKVAPKRKADTVDKREQDIAKAKADADRLNAEQKYQDNLRQGTKVTNKNGVMTFKGKQYKLGEYDGIAVTEPGEDYPKGDSMYKSLDKNGNLTAERAEIHRQVLEDYFTKIPVDGEDRPVSYKPYAPGEEKKALFTGGGGAAGKGQLSAMSLDGGGFKKFYGSDKQHLVIDADRLKYMLFQHDLKNGMYEAELKAGRSEDSLFDAGYYHNESSALADQVWSMSIDNNYPVMYDGTATKPKSVAKRLKSCRDRGYTCHSNYIFADEPTVRENSIYRFCKGDDYGMHRLVPVEVLMGAHRKAQKAVPEIASMYDSFTLWDNSGRKLTKVASQTGQKKLSIIDQGRWNTFQSAEHDDSFNYTLERRAEYKKTARARRAQWDKEHPK